MTLTEWLSAMRRDPKGRMEADLILAVVGVVIIAFGGLGTVAGFHARGSSNRLGSPLVGTILTVGGGLVLLVGLVLAAVNVVIWIRGKRHAANPQVPH